MYRRLDPARIIETAERLRRRIEERFPEAALLRVASEVLDVAREAASRAAWARRPLLALRFLVGATLAAVLAAGAAIARYHHFEARLGDLTALIQTLEAGVNLLVVGGAAVFFLVTWERRIKRDRALAGIHELRSLAHVIDLHQLTKDPERLKGDGGTTASSPPRPLSRFELERYLDYCSELLSLLSNIAALYVQEFEDPVIIAAVDEVEDLATGLSSKIWQKIMILDRMG